LWRKIEAGLTIATRTVDILSAAVDILSAALTPTLRV
jgi:hypothetical protein